MQEASYHFDIESLDDYSDDNVTLDNWRPSSARKSFRTPSNWRAEQNAKNPKDQVSLDDLRKIEMYLEANVPDEEIMETFNITKKVLIAIINKKFSAAEGIIDDETEKLKQKFENMRRNHVTLTKRVELLERTLFLSDSFKASCKMIKELIAKDEEEKREKEKKRQRVKNCKGTRSKNKEGNNDVQLQDIN